MPNPLDSTPRMVPPSPSGCAILCIAMGATRMGASPVLPAHPRAILRQAARVHVYGPEGRLKLRGIVGQACAKDSIAWGPQGVCRTGLGLRMCVAQGFGCVSFPQSQYLSEQLRSY